MEFRSTLAVYCLCILIVNSSRAAPNFSDRRVSRDLDKIDGLRARLLRLQKQIHDLEVSKDKNADGRDSGPVRGGGVAERERNDFSAEADVSTLHKAAASEDRMMSPRQREVQTLAKGLGYDKDLHELAGALSQLMRDGTEKPTFVDRANSAGEYLGDRYNVEDEHEEEEADGPSNDETPGRDEADERRLRMIYNMLLRLYSNQSNQEIRVDTRGSASQSHAHPTEYVSTSERQDPVHIDEGSFGDFVNEDRRPSLAEASANEIRQQLINAVEARLLKDVELASHAGLSVDDIIRDLQGKGEEEKEKETLRTIEQQLQEFQRLRAGQ